MQYDGRRVCGYRLWAGALMEWGQLSQWAMAAATLIAVSITGLITVLGFLFREIRAVRAESNAGRARIHQRLDQLPAEVITRREFDPTIKGLEQAITELSRTIQSLSDQFDHMQHENADGRIELLRHQTDCPARSAVSHTPKAAPTRHRGDFQ